MILGLDISTKSTGYCVLDGNNKIVDSGYISHNSADYIERSNYMAEFVRLIVSKYPIKEVVIEELKILKNQKVLVMLGICNGIILRELRDLPVTFVKPTEWRKHYGLNKTSGKGHAKREEMKDNAVRLVRAKTGKDVNDDEAEAILLAKFYKKSLTHKTK